MAQYLYQDQDPSDSDEDGGDYCLDTVPRMATASPPGDAANVPASKEDPYRNLPNFNSKHAVPRKMPEDGLASMMLPGYISHNGYSLLPVSWQTTGPFASHAERHSATSEPGQIGTPHRPQDNRPRQHETLSQVGSHFSTLMIDDNGGSELDLSEDTSVGRAPKSEDTVSRRSHSKKGPRNSAVSSRTPSSSHHDDPNAHKSAPRLRPSSRRQTDQIRRQEPKTSSSAPSLSPSSDGFTPSRMVPKKKESGDEPKKRKNDTK